MILRLVRAHNFMRYQDLLLHDLPADGAIAIVGENESGKTTIGEAIAFALFGETVKSRATDISQVISWDAEEAEVEVEVDAGKAGILRIVRRADKRGGHEATLTGVAADEAGGEPKTLARGPEEVAAKLRDLTGITFDEFRHSFYLAQAELGLVRRADAEGDGRRVIEDMVGIGTLERAAAAARKALEVARDKADELSRALGVARAVAHAQRVEPGYGEDLDREQQQSAATREECERRIPDLAARVSKLRDAENARGQAFQVFERLSRSVILARAERAAALARRDLGAIQRGLESESNRLKRELAHEEKSLGEVRARVDRLIDYQAKMAELEARIDLYKLEVKRSLDAPAIAAEDLDELEGLALPSTPAAGLKLSEARVDRLKRAKTKAIVRAAIFGVLAVASGLVGAPAARHVQPGAAPTGPIDDVLKKVVDAIAGAAGQGSEFTVWLVLAIGGCGLALLFFILMIQRIRRSMQRGDQVKLSTEAVERLQKEVKELTTERGVLDALDLKKPLKFADAVKELKNATVRDQFARIRELHNDFISSSEQRDALVAKERSDEGKHRDAAAAIQDRLARVQRLATQIPALPADARGDEEAIPDRLEAAEQRMKSLLDSLEDADRDRREVERGGSAPGEPVGLFRELQEPLERVWGAVGADASRASFLQQTRVAKIVANPGELDAGGLRQALQREAKLLEDSLPRAEKLRGDREAVEEERKTLDARHATAAARLAGLGPRIEEVRVKRARYVEAQAEADKTDAALQEHRGASELAELTAEMLEEAAGDLKRRVGPMLSRYAAAVLPRLTGGRYRRVKVGPDLDIRVYSPDKNDFVPLVDLSIGAADQLLLALRLAVSRALVAAKGLADEKHFLFLDEPMASFDETRAKAFLEILREHRDCFPQVFVVSHVHIHDAGKSFARVISPRIEARALDTTQEAEAKPTDGLMGEATLRDEERDRVRPGADNGGSGKTTRELAAAVTLDGDDDLLDVHTQTAGGAAEGDEDEEAEATEVV